MAQLVLFNNTDSPGPKEFIVIDADDLDEEELTAEYMAKVVTRGNIFLSHDSLWPLNQSLAPE